MIKKIIFIVVISLTFLYNSVLFYVDKNIASLNHDNVYNDCNKVWSARGFYSSRSEQNTIFSINSAFKNGNRGVEVDFYYDTKMDKFIVSHDKPYVLKDGKLLSLEELLLKTGTGNYFWLDYKNLDRLSSSETQSAIARLDKITKIDQLKERVYIEGSNPIKLSKYTQNGFKTIFAFHVLKESSMFTSISANIYKLAYYFFDFTAVATQYGDIEDPKYSKIAQENLKSIPTFLFHVPNDNELLKELVKAKDVRVMLVGRDQSLNRSDITNCQ